MVTLFNTVFFANTVDPRSGDLRLIRVERSIRPDPAPLRSQKIDPANADPTLARFYEKRQEEKVNHA